MEYTISYYHFIYTVQSKKALRISNIRFIPENEYFGYYVFLFNSLDRTNELIVGIEEVLATGKPKRMPGYSESILEITTNNIALVILLPGYDEPLYVDTIAFLKVLVEYREWLQLVESCQIPGIIPQSKLATWSCVPNEYVKPEYWELLKARQQESKE